MKKIVTISLIIFCFCLMTGCKVNLTNKKTNKIVCVEDSSIPRKFTVTVDDNDKIIKTEMEQIKTYISSEKDALENIYELTQQHYEQYQDLEGVKIDILKEDLTIKLMLSVDYKKASKETLEKVETNTLDETGAEFKNLMEKRGFSCK